MKKIKEEEVGSLKASLASL